MNKKTQIAIATANDHKFQEIKQILEGIPVSLRCLKDFPGIPPIAEDGSSFQENALIKARAVYRHTGLLTLADDSGLEVDALGLEPGILSARYAGKGHDYAANNRKLLRALKDVPEKRRGAQFRCMVAIVGKEIERVVEGVVRGRIIDRQRGQKGFGYDPLFVPEGFDKTFAELGEGVKNRISHRAKGFGRAREILQELGLKGNL